MRLAALPPLVTAILYLATGIFVMQRLRPREKNALAYSLWLFTTVYWQAGWAVVFSLREPEWVPFLVRLNYTGIVFIPIAFYHLVVTFLDARHDRQLLRGSYGVGCLFAVACWIDGWMVSGFYAYPWGFYARAGRIHPIYLIFLAAIAVRILYLLFERKRLANISPPDRMQLKLLRWAFISYLPAAFDFSINYGLRCYPIGFIFTLMSLSLISYAIVKHHLFDIRLIVRKTLIYSAVTLALTVIYVSVLVLLTKAFEGGGGSSHLYSSVVAAAVIAILVHPVRIRIQDWVDQRFPRESLGRKLLREATGGFAHEIKRPLVSISLPAQLALRELEEIEAKGKVRPKALHRVRERLNFILKQAHEAAEKIEAIRELTVEGSPTLEAADLGVIFKRAIEGEKERLKRGAVRLKVSVANRLAAVSGNAHQLEIAISNIIRNAADAMQKVPAARRVLRCELEMDHCQHEIKIEDTGPGIHPTDLKRLFDPWFSTKGSHGMGIGLYLTQEIIYRHGGTIEVSSKEGIGTTFRIIIPIPVH